MKISFIICLAAAALFGTGCASTEKRGVARAAQWIVVSTNQPTLRVATTNGSPTVPSATAISSEQQRVRQELAQSGVSPETLQKISEGKALSLQEIEELTAKNVNVDTIIVYLQSTDTVYVLTTEDIERMRRAGVSQKILDYLLSTRMRPTLVPSYRPYYHYPSYYYPPYEPYWSRPYPYYRSYPYRHHYTPRNSLRRIK